MGGPGTDEFWAELTRWAASERASAAAADRARGRALADQSAATATLAGVLVDLAEQGAPVAIGLKGDRVLRGRVVGVGRDALFMDLDSDRKSVV